MIRVRKIAHASYEMPDLDKQTEYYTDILGLTLTAKDKDAVYRRRLAGGPLGDLGHFFQMVPVIRAGAVQRARVEDRRQQFDLRQRNSVIRLYILRRGGEARMRAVPASQQSEYRGVVDAVGARQQRRRRHHPIAYQDTGFRRPAIRIAHQPVFRRHALLLCRRIKRGYSTIMFADWQDYWQAYRQAPHAVQRVRLPAFSRMPAIIAMRTRSDRLLAAILVIRLAR